MIDRHHQAFVTTKKQQRIAFCAGEVLGNPNPSEFLKRVKAFLKAGSDMLEFSIPFSDPTADGPTLQAAHVKALQSKVTPAKALQLITQIRKLTNVPIFLIVYSNIIFQYGISKFYHDLKQAGGDSVLIPDVPLEEIEPFAEAAKKNNIHQVMIVSENTSPERLQKLTKISKGFLYVVSTLGVTGTRKKMNAHINTFIQKLKKQTKIPLMIGFGISTAEHIKYLKRAQPDSVVVCSALVKTPLSQLQNFLIKLKNACS